MRKKIQTVYTLFIGVAILSPIEIDLNNNKDTCPGISLLHVGIKWDKMAGNIAEDVGMKEMEFCNRKETVFRFALNIYL